MPISPKPRGPIGPGAIIAAGLFFVFFFGIFLFYPFFSGNGDFSVLFSLNILTAFTLFGLILIILGFRMWHRRRSRIVSNSADNQSL